MQTIATTLAPPSGGQLIVLEPIRAATYAELQAVLNRLFCRTGAHMASYISLTDDKPWETTSTSFTSTNDNDGLHLHETQCAPVFRRKAGQAGTFRYAVFTGHIYGAQCRVQLTPWGAASPVLSLTIDNATDAWLWVASVAVFSGTQTESASIPRPFQCSLEARRTGTDCKVHQLQLQEDYITSTASLPR